MLAAYSGLIDIFVNHYDVGARCAICSNARFLIKITITSKNNEVASSTFKVEYVILFSYKTKILTKKLPDSLALLEYSMFGLTILFLYQSRD